MVTFRKANIHDIDKIINHYRLVIEQIKNYESNPGWMQDIYPKEETIIKSIESNEVYVGEIDSEIVSSMVVDHNTSQGFENVTWQVDASDDNVYYIHLVAVNQEYKNRGIAKKMLKHVFEEAINNSIKSLRLSLNKTNLGIKNLYTKLDFKHVDSIKVDHEDRGILFFEIYEKLI